MSRLTVESAQRMFHDLNVRFFYHKLPDVEIEIVADLRQRKTAETGRYRLWGATEKHADGAFLIQLQSGMPYHLWVLKLAHEMAHVEVWPKSHRSKEWKAVIARLGREGFLAEVL